MCLQFMTDRKVPLEPLVVQGHLANDWNSCVTMNEELMHRETEKRTEEQV